MKDSKNQNRNAYVFRSLTAGMYNTLCLPFDVTLAGSCLEDAKAYAYSGSTDMGGDIVLNFNEVNSLEAGVPYLIEPQEDIEALEFMDVEITVTDAEAEKVGADITFNGILAPKTLEANNKSILFLVSGNRLAWANTTAEMYGMRGYFEVQEGTYNKLSTRAYINIRPQNTTTSTEHTTITAPTATKFIKDGVFYILKDNQLYTPLGTKITQLP